MTFFGFNPSNINSLKCVSMNNQECKTRPKIIDVNSNEPLFHLYSIKVNKCRVSCNNINDPYARSDMVRNMNLKVFNLISWSNQRKQIEWHEIQVLVIINKDGIKINADVNVKN